MSKKSKLKQPEQVKTESIPVKVKVSPWPRRRRIACHFFSCGTKSFLVWVVITFVSCIVYAAIVYCSLVNRDIFRRFENTIPNYHHPLQYNITLRFAADYNNAHNLSFNGQTQLLFEPTVLTPNFVMNIGPNVDIHQIYFQRIFDGIFFKGIKTRGVIVGLKIFNSIKLTLLDLTHIINAQTISYVISFMFEPGRRYLAVIDFTGQLYPPAGMRKTPRLILFEQNKKQSYAIVHINPSDSRKGLRFVTPSLDHDSFLTKFVVNIERHIDYRAISNMPNEQSINYTSDKLGKDIFSPTIPIRPSQLSFVVSNLNFSTVYDCGTSKPLPTPLRVNFINNKIKEVGHFFGSLMDKLESSNLMQFPKLDNVILPDVETADQPGISILNNHDAEKFATSNLNERFRTQC